MGPYFPRKYATGTGADVYIPMIKRAVVDHAVSADWTPTTGDVKISIDGGVAANINTLPVAIAMGNGAYWKFVFSDVELTGKQMYIEIADSTTKAVEDNGFGISTYGHASAMFVTDFSIAMITASDIVTALYATAAITPLKINIKSINDRAIQGNGTSGNKWRPI